MTALFTERLETAMGPQKLAYRQQAGEGTGLVFCGGFRSDMTGTKATALADWAREKTAPIRGLIISATAPQPVPLPMAQ